MFEPVVFHWNLSDSKSPQISRMLLSILTNFSRAVTWMDLILLFVSRLPSLFTRFSWTVPRALNRTTIAFSLLNFFSSQARFRYLSKFWFISFFPFVLWWNGKIYFTSPLLANQNEVWSSGLDWVIRYLEIPDNFVSHFQRHILFWMHMLFVLNAYVICFECICYLILWSNFSHLRNSLRNIFPA